MYIHLNPHVLEWNGMKFSLGPVWLSYGFWKSSCELWLFEKLLWIESCGFSKSPFG
jgi:hypothetical protein